MVSSLDIRIPSTVSGPEIFFIKMYWASWTLVSMRPSEGFWVLGFRVLGYWCLGFIPDLRQWVERRTTTDGHEEAAQTTGPSRKGL